MGEWTPLLQIFFHSSKFKIVITARRVSARRENGTQGLLLLLSVTEITLFRRDYSASNLEVCVVCYGWRVRYLTPDEPGYLSLVSSLRQGDCS